MTLILVKFVAVLDSLKPGLESCYSNSFHTVRLCSHYTGRMAFRRATKSYRVLIVWTETEPATHVAHNLDPWALLRMTTREGRALGNPGTRLSLIGSRKKKTCFWLVHSNFHERGWTCGVSGDSKTTVALRQSDWIPQFSNKIHLATYRKDLNVKNKNTTTPLPAKIIGREGKLSLIVILLHHVHFPGQSG